MVSNGQDSDRRSGNDRCERAARRRERHASRRRLKPEARRAELVAAALALLREHNAGEIKIEDVTRAAGAAKGTFYLYFSSWNELIGAVRDHVLGAFIEQLLDRFAAVGSAAEWWTALEEECARFVDFHIELGTVHNAIFHGGESEHLILAEHSDERIITRLIIQGIALGACREVDPELAAPMVFAVLHATADGARRSGRRDERVEALLTMLRSWLSVPMQEKGL
jgi:AcrR family transcriptional regulator